MYWLYPWMSLFFTGCGGLSYSSLQSRLVGEESNRTVPLGGSASLTCSVHNVRGSSIVWRRGFEVLATGDLKITADPRVGVECQGGRSTLTLHPVGRMDTGEYVCQVSTIGEPISTSFYLDVQVAASVTAWSPHVTGKEGDTLELRCNVSGNPLPTLAWSRGGAGLGSSSSCGGCLRIAGLDPSHSGYYECQAENGVPGPPATAQVKLTVQYPPVVTVDEDSIPTGLGLQVLLKCGVEGDPVPHLTWQFQDIPLSSQPNLVLSSRGRLHSLHIQSVEEHSLGNYSCLAHNSLGSFKKYVEVHGRPGRVELRSDPRRSSRHQHHLTWWLVTYSPVTEFRLLYRLTDKDTGEDGYGSDWTNVIIPGSHQGRAYKTKTEWIIQNLIPESSYECLVQARNKYGWSEPSSRLSFTTTNPVLKSASTQNFGRDPLKFSKSPASVNPTLHWLQSVTLLYCFF